jgi:hypothetical protein
VFIDAPQITGINDILRYDIRAYLRKMDEPVQLKSYLDGEQLKTMSCHKIYRLNIVSRYRSILPEKHKIHKRLRLIINRSGIKRIEHIQV